MMPNILNEMFIIKLKKEDMIVDESSISLYTFMTGQNIQMVDFTGTEHHFRLELLANNFQLKPPVCTMQITTRRPVPELQSQNDESSKSETAEDQKKIIDYTINKVSLSIGNTSIQFLQTNKHSFIITEEIKQAFLNKTIKTIELELQELVVDNEENKKDENEDEQPICIMEKVPLNFEGIQIPESLKDTLEFTSEKLGIINIAMELTETLRKKWIKEPLDCTAFLPEKLDPKGHNLCDETIPMKEFRFMLKKCFDMLKEQHKEFNMRQGNKKSFKELVQERGLQHYLEKLLEPTVLKMIPDLFFKNADGTQEEGDMLKARLLNYLNDEVEKLKFPNDINNQSIQENSPIKGEGKQKKNNQGVRIKKKCRRFCNM
eukprot:UN32392